MSRGNFETSGEVVDVVPAFAFTALHSPSRFYFFEWIPLSTHLNLINYKSVHFNIIILWVEG